jgi:hypothetical protein
LGYAEVWEEFQGRGADGAVVPFSGRAGVGGKIGTIVLTGWRGGELVDVERWTGRDDLAYALEGPVWDRYGEFAGQPWIRGHVAWTSRDHGVLIVGERGGEPFEEKLQ